jgi:basic amino acid/polyamine antiporter, APA family
MNKAPHKLGLFALIALVTGNMIGSGIFLLPASLAQVGSISLVAWLITGAGALLLAFIFANFSMLIPKVGGPYAYVRSGLGTFLGFQTAYCYWIAAWVGNAAIAIALVSYLSIFFPLLAQPWPACLSAIVLLWLLTLLNISSVKGVGVFQIATTLLKLLPIIFIALIGWFYIHPENFTQAINVTEPHRSNFSAINYAAALTFWSFIGLESATVPAGSVHNPRKTIPLATLLGTSIAAVVYIASSAAIMGIVPIEQLQASNAPFALAAEIMVGPIGKYIIALGAIISCLGCLNGWVLLQGQIAMAAADDGVFPARFSKRNKAGIPAFAVITTSVLISILLLMTVSKTLMEQFELIILIAVFATLVPYFYTVLAYWVKQRESTATRKNIAKLLVALLAGTYVIWALLGSGQKVIAYGAMLLLSSVFMYVPILVKRGKAYVD